MSTNVHPERETRRQQEKRVNQRTALLAGVGSGIFLALLTGLLLESWPFAIGLGVVDALGVTLALNAIRKDSRKVVDDAPESEA